MTTKDVSYPRLPPLAGGPLRALVTVIGLDQHEAGSLAVARLLRDAGAEVIYAGRFQLPETIAAMAIEEDVDVVGVSAHSWEFLQYAPELVALLHAADPPIPIAVGGSVITAADCQQLVDQGIDEAVLPTANSAEIVAAFHRLAERHRAR
jgi:methylmalonyl-CoA mutase cobalamin-binding domain/chain